jgi:NAD-dependent DNA ligase
MNQQELETLLNTYDAAYFHSQETKISDQEYDALVDQYELLYGKYTPNGMKGLMEGLTHTACKLPSYSPSLAKIKTLPKFHAWTQKNKGPYVVMDKVDGISLILNYLPEGVKMYTHSTCGLMGSDVSHLLKYLNLPKIQLNEGERIEIRGELAMTWETFKKYEKEYEGHPRNLISGVVNATKNIKYDFLGDFTFYAFEVKYANGYDLNMVEQLHFLSIKKFLTPDYKVLPQVTFDELTAIMKQPSLVPRDGLVIATNTYEKVLNKLPKQKIAFKIVGETIKVTVIEVEWNESKNQLLKPRIHFDTVLLEKGKCSYCTGHNAAFIRDYNVGPGTELIISRDIVANIISVPKQTEASLPIVDYIWNKTNVDIVCEMNDNIAAKRIYIFFDALGAKYLGLKTIKKLYEGGYKTVNSLLIATVDELCLLNGFQKTGVTRIINSIKGIYKNINVVDVMFGSCLFPNLGKIKLQTLINTIPKIYDIILFNDNYVLTIEELQKTPGIKTMANSFLSGVSLFKTFLDNIPSVKETLINQYIKNNTPMVEIVSSPINSTNDSLITTPPLLVPDSCNDKPLMGMYIVFTGDKKMTDVTKGLGAVVQPGINKSTTLVVVNNIGDNTNKEVTAKTRGIPIMSLSDFKQNHLKTDL